MKKLLTIAVTVAVVGAGVALVVMTRPGKADDGSTPAAAQSDTVATKSSAKDACALFTLADAKKLLGDSAVAGSGNTDKPTESDSIRVSICTFITDTGDSIDAIQDARTASLLVRAPKNQAGIDSNKNQFGSAKPAGVTDVSGYGDVAYWDPRYGQLNILEHDTWYILSIGSTTAGQRTLDDGKQMADVLAANL